MSSINAKSISMFVYIPKDTMNEERLDSSVSDKKVMTILGVRRSIAAIGTVNQCY